MNRSFILIENAELDQYVAIQLLKKIADEAVVESFFTAEEALVHIAADKTPEIERQIILLDLMMPEMSGADFIKKFEKLPQKLRKKYRIVIITSSMDKPELERLNNRKSVALTVAKPLTHEKLASALAQLSVDENQFDA